jgi:hypothetical protein
VVPLTRTAIALLAGLLAMTVPVQPAEAATCGPADTPSCVATVMALAQTARDTADKAVADAEAIADRIVEGLCGEGGTADCGETVAGMVDEAVQEILGLVMPIVLQACEGSLSRCDDVVLAIVNREVGAVVGRVEQACGGSTATCDDLVLAIVNGEVQKAVDLVEAQCDGAVARCDDVVREEVDETVEEADRFANEAVSLALWAVGTGQTLYRNAADQDADNVPTAVESEICGRALVRDYVNMNAPFLGACVTPADYSPPAAGTYVAAVLALAAFVLAEALAAAAFVDGVVDGAVAQGLAIASGAVTTALRTAGDNDRDGVPDDREPLACAIENQNSPTDGTCTGGDYSGVAFPV